jgi:Type II secretion system (T2SS), protein E, N-terminal domain
METNGTVAAALDEAPLAAPGARAAREPLVNLLVAAGIASEEELRLAMAEGMGTGERLGEVVVRKGWINGAGLARLLAEQWGLPHLELPPDAPQRSAFERLSAEDARRLGACPISLEGERLMVAIAEPSDQRLGELARIAGEISPVVVSADALEKLLAPAAAGTEEAAAAATAAEPKSVGEPIEPLVAELEASLARLSSLHEQVERLVAALARTRSELAELRQTFTASKTERAEQEAALARTQAELMQRDQLLGSLKTLLAETDDARR